MSAVGKTFVAASKTLAKAALKGAKEGVKEGAKEAAKEETKRLFLHHTKGLGAAGAAATPVTRHVAFAPSPVAGAAAAAPLAGLFSERHMFPTLCDCDISKVMAKNPDGSSIIKCFACQKDSSRVNKGAASIFLTERMGASFLERGRTRAKAAGSKSSTENGAGGASGRARSRSRARSGSGNNNGASGGGRGRTRRAARSARR